MNKVLIGGAIAAACLGGAAIAQTPGQAAPGAHAAPKQHMMMNKTVTRAEVSQEVRDMFARLDTNRDGFITREEADAGRQVMRGEIAKRMAERGARPDRGAMFDRLDTNKDGMISRQEYMAAQPQVHERRIVMMGGGKMGMHRAGMGFGGRMFETADTNKDGRVSLAEAQAAALARFDRMDLNRDGQLTPEERKQAREQFKAQRRPS